MQKQAGGSHQFYSLKSVYYYIKIVFMWLINLVKSTQVEKVTFSTLRSNDFKNLPHVIKDIYAFSYKVVLMMTWYKMLDLGKCSLIGE